MSRSWRDVSYFELWVNPYTNELERGVPLIFIKADGTFGNRSLYLVDKLEYIHDYTNWDYWCVYANT